MAHGAEETEARLGRTPVLLLLHRKVNLILFLLGRRRRRRWASAAGRRSTVCCTGLQGWGESVRGCSCTFGPVITAAAAAAAAIVSSADPVRTQRSSRRPPTLAGRLADLPARMRAVMPLAFFYLFYFMCGGVCCLSDLSHWPART